MDVNEIVSAVEEKLLLRTLSPIERLVLGQSWQGRTYEAIARESAYGSDYIKEVGARLWSDLSATLNERVTKKNLHLVLKHHLNTAMARTIAIASNLTTPSLRSTVDFPGGPLPLDSPIYIERLPLEDLVCAEIEQPGCALRIQGSRKVGKSSLLIRLLAHAENLGYESVQIDCQEADIAIFESFNRFLRWFCANTSCQLNLEPRLDEYWQEDLLGSKLSCKLYFEQYLLPQLKHPLVIALNEVNCIFNYPSVAQDFLALLRSWYEQSMQSKLWQNLRLVLVQTTELCQPLDINQSPFNVGLVVQLPNFSLEQVQTLAQRYGLTWASGENGKRYLASLYTCVGGHPYLVNIAFSHLAQGQLTLEQLLQNAPTPAGIYSEHLRGHLLTLQAKPELALAFEKAIQANTAVQLDAIAAYQLESMGLIRFDGDLALPSCQLYRQFFREHLTTTTVPGIRLEQLQSENQHLQHLSGLDELTGLANRRQFDHYLEQVWQEQKDLQTPLSIILGDLDHFKLFNSTRGHLAGDTCLQLVARVLEESVIHPHSAIARYGGEEFAILLPHTFLEGAMETAEIIRDRIKALAIAHDQTQISGLPDEMLTISIGVATLIPDRQTASEILVDLAERALYQAKRLGRDRVETTNYPQSSAISS
jgi:diguanylate cyclase (GGDEF)-like protein